MLPLESMRQTWLSLRAKNSRAPSVASCANAIPPVDGRNIAVPSVRRTIQNSLWSISDQIRSAVSTSDVTELFVGCLAANFRRVIGIDARTVAEFPTASLAVIGTSNIVAAGGAVLVFT